MDNYDHADDLIFHNAECVECHKDFSRCFKTTYICSACEYDKKGRLSI